MAVESSSAAPTDGKSSADGDGQARTDEQWRKVRFKELENVYQSAAAGLAVVDRKQQVVCLNRILSDIVGIVESGNAVSQASRRVDEVFVGFGGQVESVVQRVLQTGGAEFHAHLGGHQAAPNGSQHALHCHALQDNSENLIGVGLVLLVSAESQSAESQNAESQNAESQSAESQSAESQSAESPPSLEQREHLLSVAERNAMLGSWRLDVATQVLDWSDELYRIFGLDRSTTKPSFEVFLKCLHPDDRALAESRFAERLASDVTRDEFEYRIVRSDGEVRHILAIATFLRTDSGEPTSVYGTAQDITKWRETERALRQSEENLASILGTATDIVMSLDRQGTILYINHVVPGLTREQVIGTSGFDYLPPDSRPSFRAAMNQVCTTRAPYQYEIEAVGPSGTTAWYSCRLGPVLRGDEVIGFTLLTSDITQRRASETALKANEQFFRTIFEQAAVSVALIETKTGKFIKVNEKCAEISGYSVEEMENMTLMDVSYKAELQENLDNLQRMLAGEIREFEMEKRLLCKDGTITWVHLTVSATWKPGDEPKYHVAIVDDISSRKSFEQAIVASEQKFRQLIETTHEGVWVIDSEGETTFVNERLAEMLGYAPEEMVGNHIFAFMDEEATQEAQRQLERRKAGIGEQHDFRLRRKDGSDLWTNMSTNPLTDEDGNHNGALAMVTDITERKHMEWELKQSHDQLESRVLARTSELIASNNKLQDEIAERKRIDKERGRLSSIIEATPDFVGSADPSGRVRYLNQSARRALGVAPDECLDHARIEDFHTESASKLLFETAIPATLRDGSWKGEVYWRTRDGKEIPTAMVLQAHYSRAGDIELISTIAHDITELREAEGALRRAERLASIGTLAAGIAHEINNPLGAMLLTSEYALRKLDNHEVVEESLQNILANVERCAQIVRSVLQFSRDGHSQKSTHELSEFIRRAQDLTRPQAEEAGVSVETEVSRNSCQVRVNPLEIEQVFVNLIANAIQSSSAGEFVNVSADILDNCVCIVIKDQGVGMSAEIRSRVFDPFFTTRIHAGGTGLGLSIVHGIVRDHGGAIDVWSEPNQGTKVTVTLPLSQRGQG